MKISCSTVTEDILQEKLSQFSGFHIPDTFGKVLYKAFIGATESGKYDDATFITFYDYMFDFFLPMSVSEEDCYHLERYHSYMDIYAVVPPELCVFGIKEEINYGFIVHNPSFDMIDWPIGKLGKGETHVTRYGDTTKGAFESLLSLTLLNWRNHGGPTTRGDEKIFEELKELIEVTPDPDAFLAGIDKGDPSKYRPAHPIIPEGWHFISTKDGIGAFGPSASFKEETLMEFTGIDQVESLMDQGFFGSVLAIAREELWEKQHKWEEADIELAYLWKEAYQRLDRALFAERVQKKIEYYKE